MVHFLQLDVEHRDVVTLTTAGPYVLAVTSGVTALDECKTGFAHTYKSVSTVVLGGRFAAHTLFLRILNHNRTPKS